MVLTLKERLARIVFPEPRGPDEELDRRGASDIRLLFKDLPLEDQQTVESVPGLENDSILHMVYWIKGEGMLHWAFGVQHLATSFAEGSLLRGRHILLFISLCR
jgi:hypothetical protein